MIRSHRHVPRLVRVLILAILAVAGMMGSPAHATSGGPSDPSLALEHARAWVEQSQQIQDYVAARQREEVGAILRAVALSEYLASLPYIPVDWARWEALHTCEQPGNWYANGTNPADPDGQVFQGGLGMSTHAWQMAVWAAGARGVTLPESALAATPQEQMTGSQAFFDAYGWAWACQV
jgi:hypothetical protein